jgi:hypothetical protein
MAIVVFLLVRVDQVDVARMAALEAKDDAPIARHAHGPTPFHISGEGVKLEAGKVHLLGRIGFVEAGADTADLIHPIRREAFASVFFIEPRQPAVPKGPDHEEV